jgi:hypothetical protein
MSRATILLLLLPLTLRAADRNAVAIVERAIKAHGGREALARAARSTRACTGTLSLLGKDVPLVRRVTQDLPDRLRVEIEAGKRVRSVLVLDGGRAFQADGGPTITLLPRRVRELREEAHLWWVSTLVPLTKPEFILRALPQTKDAVGVVASFRGQPDVKLWFSKSTGLLERMESRGPEAGVLVDREQTLSDYKDFAGVKLPTRESVKHDGHIITSCTISGYTFPKKLEASLFSKP